MPLSSLPFQFLSKALPLTRAVNTLFTCYMNICVTSQKSDFVYTKKKLHASSALDFESIVDHWHSGLWQECQDVIKQFFLWRVWNFGSNSMSHRQNCTCCPIIDLSLWKLPKHWITWKYLSCNPTSRHNFPYIFQCFDNATWPCVIATKQRCMTSLQYQYSINVCNILHMVAFHWTRDNFSLNQAIFNLLEIW